MLLIFLKKLRSILFYRIFVDPVRWPPGKLLLGSLVSFLLFPLTLYVYYLLSNIGLSLPYTSIVNAWMYMIPFFFLYLALRLAGKSRRSARAALKANFLGIDKKLRLKYFCYQILGDIFSIIFSFFLLALFFGVSRGRQVRHRGKVILPPLTPNDKWTQLSHSPSISSVARSDIANQWRENGKTEYASVSAFAALVQELVALGCPPDLISAAHRDGLDEIRHAELCFSLAKDIDGRDIGPGAFPKSLRRSHFVRFKTLALMRLAFYSLIDGALLEAVSGRIAGRLARTCEDVSTQRVLKIIAADEMRHAAHAWEVVEWCVAEGGYLLYSFLSRAFTRLPDSMQINLPASAVDGSWERYGIHGAEMQQQEYARAKADLLRRLRALRAKEFQGIEGLSLPEIA